MRPNPDVAAEAGTLSGHPVPSFGSLSTEEVGKVAELAQSFADLVTGRQAIRSPLALHGLGWGANVAFRLSGEEKVAATVAEMVHVVTTKGRSAFVEMAAALTFAKDLPEGRGVATLEAAGDGLSGPPEPYAPEDSVPLSHVVDQLVQLAAQPTARDREVMATCILRGAAEAFAIEGRTRVVQALWMTMGMVEEQGLDAYVTSRRMQWAEEEAQMAAPRN